MLIGILLSLMIYTDKAPISFNLTNHGIYTLGKLTLHKVGDHYLFVSLGDNPSLSIVDRHDKQLFRYDKAGRGPGELNLHSVLGITDDKIYVNSQRVGILIFDHQLQLLSQGQYTLEQDQSMFKPFGVALKNEQFLIKGNPYLPFHFSLFDLKDLKENYPWVSDQSLIAKKNPEERQEERSHLHNNHLFAYSRAVYFNQPEYRVHVYTQAKDQWPQVAELSTTTDDLIPPFPEVFALIVAGYKLGDYYIVDLMSGLEGKAKTNQFQTNLDIFDANGKFLKRISKPEQFITPVTNADEIFIYEEREDDFLVAFDPEAYLKR